MSGTIFYPYKLPDELLADQARMNACQNAFNDRFREHKRIEYAQQERELLAAWRRCGWREWVELQFTWTFPSVWDMPWKVVTRKPSGLRGWLRHKIWWAKMWRAVRKGKNTPEAGKEKCA